VFDNVDVLLVEDDELKLVFVEFEALDALDVWGVDWYVVDGE